MSRHVHLKRPRTTRRVVAEALEFRRLLSADDLDPTFGTGGKVLTDLPGSLSGAAYSAVYQSDGKLLVVGRAARAGDADADMFVARYAPGTAATLDPSFGGGAGYVTIDFGRLEEAAYTVALAPGGKIVVGGFAGDVSTGPLGPADFALARLNPDGSLDTTFDLDGRRTIDLPSTRAEVYDIAVRADGSMVAVGTGGGLTIAALRADGSSDPTFDTDGLMSSNLGSGAYTVVIDASGRILVGGGRIESFDPGRPAPIVRFLPTGAVDRTFGGGDGVADVFFAPAPGSPPVADLTLISGGRIIAVGANFAAARLSPDGVLDNTYGGGDGVASGGGGGSSRSGVVLPDGSVVVAGSTVPPVGSTASSPILVKFTPDGEPDPSFGSAGRVTTGIGWVNDVVLAPGGGLVTVGATSNLATTPSQVVVTHRLATDSSIPPSAPAGSATSSPTSSARARRRLPTWSHCLTGARWRPAGALARAAGATTLPWRTTPRRASLTARSPAASPTPTTTSRTTLQRP